MLPLAIPCGGSPQTERKGGTNHCARYCAEGAGQMRTLRELESDIEINDPLEGMDDLSNQPINDPDD
jgi:hypothetical protein